MVVENILRLKNILSFMAPGPDLMYLCVVSFK